MRATSDAPRLLVVELDGATWTVMEPLLAAGRLPHIKSMMADGSHGILRSVKPMMSPVAWTSIWTGMHPDKHGIRDFLSRADSDLLCVRLWDILMSRLGWRCGLLDCFLTWPPEPSFNGFVVPNSLALDHRTLPPSYGWFHRLCYGRDNTPATRLGQYLRLAVSGCRPATLARLLWLQARGRLVEKDSRLLFLDRLLMFQCELQTEFFLHLLDAHRPQFAVIHLHVVDMVQHSFWRERQTPRSAFGDAVDRAYEACDLAVGRLLSRAAHDTRVIVLSDHGAEAAGPLHEFRVPLERVLARLGWGFPGLSYFDPRAGVPETHVHSPDPAWLSRLARLFETARWDPEGAPAFSVRSSPGDAHRLVLRYEVPPERLARSGHGIQWPQARRRLPAEEVFVRTGVTGMHHPDGIWLLSGPGIREGYRFPAASAVDVTPTLLRLLGLPVARDMDGAIRMDLLEENGKPPPEPAFVESYGCPPRIPLAPGGGDAALEDPMSDVRQRLRSMGYLE